MKKLLCAILSAAVLAGCAAPAVQTTPPSESVSQESFETKWSESGFVRIQLDDTAPAVALPDGMPETAVTFAQDILYYEAGHGEDYGEGEAWEAHTAQEAARHTVVHINAPGTYVLTGKLSAGQIAVDLGEDAKNDPNAVVTLILDSLNITCTVAPAVIFYHVYESGQPGTAGANVILADGSLNYITGSHVAKIYKPGTEDKLHKYDAAFYSRMSMTIGGEGFVHIAADNEGLGTEMHLTVNSGEISIVSGNDGINTNEDGVSVTTVNGGTLRIEVSGSTGEGDGIDSNGSVVINGGHIFAYACGTSEDSGIDADLGIYLNGGTVAATGNMLDRIEDGGQTYAVFTFAQNQKPGLFTLKDETLAAVCQVETPNTFRNLLLSAPTLTEGTYTLWAGETPLQGVVSPGGYGFIGSGPIEFPQRPGRGDGDVEIPPQPTQPVFVQGQGEGGMPVPSIPEDVELMPLPQMPQNGEPMPPMPGNPGGVEPPQDGFGRQPIGSAHTVGILTTEFPIKPGANFFTNLQAVE